MLEQRNGFCNSSIVKSVDNGFNSIVSKNYAGEVFLRNFADSNNVADEINKWTANNTNNYISKIVDALSISNDNPLYIFNALFFKGLWKNKFDVANTAQSDFYNNNNEVIGKVDMMYQELRVQYQNTEQMRSIKLDYGQTDKSNASYDMIIILPNDGVDFGTAVKSSLDNDFNYADFNIYIPKFEVDYNTSLNSYLRQVGLDLSNIYLPVINQTSSATIMQSTKIKVDEEGTTAAAASGVGYSIAYVPDEIFTFRADRPFAFIIEESASHTILFMGKIANPTK